MPQLPARLRPQLIPNPAFVTFPTAAQCQAILNDPNRTMLGKAQLAHFENAIKRSKATFKVIMNEIPIQKMYFVPYDRWEGYNAEREALLSSSRPTSRTSSSSPPTFTRRSSTTCG